MFGESRENVVCPQLVYCVPDCLLQKDNYHLVDTNTVLAPSNMSTKIAEVSLG